MANLSTFVICIIFIGMGMLRGCWNLSVPEIWHKFVWNTKKKTNYFNTCLHIHHKTQRCSTCNQRLFHIHIKKSNCTIMLLLKLIAFQIVDFLNTDCSLSIATAIILQADQFILGICHGFASCTSCAIHPLAADFCTLCDWFASCSNGFLVLCPCVRLSEQHVCNRQGVMVYTQNLSNTDLGGGGCYSVLAHCIWAVRLSPVPTQYWSPKQFFPGDYRLSTSSTSPVWNPYLY